MSLRFPHIRLEVYGLLLSTGDCVAAFAQVARKYGLACPEDLTPVRTQIEQGMCGSMAIARYVLLANAPQSAEKLWVQLVDKVEQFKLAQDKPHYCGIQPNLSVIDCSGMAPVVMDFLLQLLDGHSHHSSASLDRQKMND